MNVHDLLLRLRALIRPRRAEQELSEELEAHLEFEVRKSMARGLTEVEARRRARIDFGGVERVREECRDVRGLQVFESIWRDLKYAGRTLRKSAGFTAVTVLALAIGIGANAALLHSFLSALKPKLPFPDSDRLAVLWLKSQKDPKYDSMMFSVPDMLDWRARSHAFSGIAASTWTQQTNLGVNGASERIRAFEVTANLFDVLGVQPRLGRAFLESEQVAGRNRVAILGARMWEKHFASNPSVLGSAIKLDGETYTVIGVLGADFSIGFVPDPDVLIPLALDSSASLDRARRATFGIGRLRDGVSVEQARSETAAIEEHLGTEHSEDAGWTVNATLLQNEGTKDAWEKLPFFAALAAIVLLLACLNSAGLSLARYVNRQSEMVVRTALGAGRTRLVQQILCEGALVAMLAGVLGFAIAIGGIALIRRYQPFYSNFPIAPMPEPRIFGYYALLICGAALLFGSLPALITSRLATVSGLNAASARISGARTRLRAVLMTLQIAVAVAVVCVTGLMARTVQRLYHFDLGFEPAGLIEGEVVLKGTRYATATAQRDFFDRVIQMLGSDPRIRAGLASHFPLSQSYGMSGYTVQREDRPLKIEKQVSMTGAHAVSARYFQLLHAQIVRGRDFQEHESEPVTIVNESFAQKYFPGENPVGKRLLVLGAAMKEMDELAPGARRIVGVVKDLSEWNPRVVSGWPHIYVPFDQNPVPWVSIAISGAGVEAIRNRLAELDSNIPLFRAHSASELVDQTFAPARFQLMILELFSALALFLSAIGIFSLVAHSVRSRRREFGIRFALGATPAQIRRLAMRGGFSIAAVGLVLGLGLAMLLGRLMATILYKVNPWDGQLAAAAVMVVSATIAAACFLPAHEASRVEPSSALRE